MGLAVGDNDDCGQCQGTEIGNVWSRRSSGGGGIRRRSERYTGQTVAAGGVLAAAKLARIQCRRHCNHAQNCFWQQRFANKKTHRRLIPGAEWQLHPSREAGLLVEVSLLISTQCQGTEIGKVWRRRSVGGIGQGGEWSHNKGWGGLKNSLMHCTIALAPYIDGDGNNTT